MLDEVVNGSDWSEDQFARRDTWILMPHKPQDNFF